MSNEHHSYFGLENFLENAKIWHRSNFRMKEGTYFKTGGVADFFIEPKDRDDFKILMRFILNNKIDYKIIGGTSNLFFLDEINYGVIISTKNFNKFDLLGNYAYVDPGYFLSDFVRMSVLSCVTGYEGLEGIPGTIGGAIYMNAGAYGQSISDNLISVDCMDQRGEVFVLKRGECDFSHRHSFFKKNPQIIIVGAKFDFSKQGKLFEIHKKIEKFHIARHSYQEFVFPTIGSAFSVGGGVYREIFYNFGFLGKICFFIVKIVYSNHFVKFIKRKNPSNGLLNRVVMKFSGEAPSDFSHKSINILVNSGRNSSRQMIDYLLFLRKLLDKKIPIENEIVVHPIASHFDASKIKDIVEDKKFLES